MSISTDAKNPRNPRHLPEIASSLWNSGAYREVSGFAQLGHEGFKSLESLASPFF